MNAIKKARRCCVPGCNNNSKTNSDIAYYRFPRDERRAREWIEHINRPDLMNKELSTLYNCYKICSEHFDPNVCEKNRLKTYAIPIINKPGKKLSQKIVLNETQDNTHIDSPKLALTGTLQEPILVNATGNVTSTLTDANGMELPVYLHVESNLINENLQQKILNLIGNNNDLDGPIVTNITEEQFQKICNILSTENVIL